MIVTLDQVIAGVLKQVLYLLFPFCNIVEELLTLSLVMLKTLGPVNSLQSRARHCAIDPF